MFSYTLYNHCMNKDNIYIYGIQCWKKEGRQFSCPLCVGVIIDIDTVTQVAQNGLNFENTEYSLGSFELFLDLNVKFTADR